MHKNMLALAGLVFSEPIVNLVRGAFHEDIEGLAFEPLKVPEAYIPVTHQVVGTVGNTSLIIRELVRALKPHRSRCNMVVSALAEQDADPAFVRQAVTDQQLVEDRIEFLEQLLRLNIVGQYPEYAGGKFVDLEGTILVPKGSAESKLLFPEGKNPLTMFFDNLALALDGKLGDVNGATARAKFEDHCCDGRCDVRDPKACFEIGTNPVIQSLLHLMTFSMELRRPFVGPEDPDQATIWKATKTGGEMEVLRRQAEFCQTIYQVANKLFFHAVCDANPTIRTPHEIGRLAITKDGWVIQELSLGGASVVEMAVPPELLSRILSRLGRRPAGPLG